MSFVKLLKSINPTLVIKRWEKARQFRENSELGQGVLITADAACSNDQGQIVIGDYCEIHAQLIVRGTGQLTIGAHTFIGPDTIIGAKERIDIGECCIISNHVHIYDNNNHPTDPQARKRMSLYRRTDRSLWSWAHAESASVVIGENVWICEYSTILKGITVGKGSIVASHTVVTEDVPEYAVVAGNPARIVKMLASGDL